MTHAAQSKITARHLVRRACVYVRRAVWPADESTAAQYALRQRAVALGWQPERIVVIDRDIGHAGTSARDRAGFRRLVAEITRGRVGLLLALEVSRLTRALGDWERLVKLCARTNTLIWLDGAVHDADELGALLGLVPEHRA